MRTCGAHGTYDIGGCPYCKREKLRPNYYVSGGYKAKLAPVTHTNGMVGDGTGHSVMSEEGTSEPDCEDSA